MSLQTAATLSGTNNTTLREVVKNYIDNMPDNTSFTATEITSYIRGQVNNRSLTIANIPVNSVTDGRYFLAENVFERQTIYYCTVRGALLELLCEYPNISYTLDPTGRYNVFTKNPAISTKNAWVSAPTPAPAPAAPTVIASPPPSLAERLLDDSLTHLFIIKLNGKLLTLENQFAFTSKQEAEGAVVSRLAQAIDGSDKQLLKEMRCLVQQGKLEFVRGRIS